MKALEKPLTLDELRKMQNEQGSITAVISYAWDETGDIETLNDAASELITGDICALEDIGYRLVGADVDAQEVLIEVTGTVENWLAEQDEEEVYVDEKQGYSVRDNALYHSMYPADSLGEFQDDTFVPSKFLLELPPDCHRLVDAWTKEYMEKQHGNG